jgi:hypothetical protein
VGFGRMQEDPYTVAKVEDFARRLTRDKFRFVVGTPGGRYSDSWFAGWNRNDYYLGSRSFGGSMKISLHDEENCRLAFTNESISAHMQQGLDLPRDRAFVEWYRKPSPEDGAVHVVSLIFPTDYLCLPQPEASYKKPVLIVEAARPGKAIEFAFFFSREAEATVEAKFLRIGQPLVRTTLDNCEAVWVVARETEFDQAEIPSEERWTGSVRFHDKQAFLDEGVQLDGLTSMLWNSPKDGESLRVIEIGGVTASVRAGLPVFRVEPSG